MGEIFKLFGTIGLKDEASDEIDKVTGKAKGLTGIFGKVAGAGGKLISGLGKIAAITGIVKLTSAAFNMVKDSISSAFARIDTMEQFNRVMTVMTGSADKANAILKTTTDIVTGTAYGLDVAALAVQNFVTSNMDVDKATDTVAAWGDAVAFYGDGSNATFASVSDALAKMSSKGKVSMEEMNRLTEAGIPAMQIYADATGQSVEEVANQMQKGELSADEFTTVMNDALANGTDKFAGIAGAAKEAGASWGAAFDNMKAAVTRGVVKIISTIDEMLTTNGLPDMREMVATFGKKFEETLTKVAEAIPKVIDKIKEMKDAFMDSAALQAAIDAVDKFKEVMAFLKDNIELVSVAVATLTAILVAHNIQAILAAAASGAQTVAIIALYAAEFIAAAATTALTAATTAFTAVMAVLTSPITWVIVAIGLLVAAGVLLWKNWDEVSAKAGEVWGALKEWFSETMAAIADNLKKAWDGVKTYFSELWTDIKNGATENWEAFSSWISGMWQSIVDGATEIWDSFATWISGIWQGIVDGAVFIWEGLVNVFTFIWLLIKEVFHAGWLLISVPLILAWQMIVIAALAIWQPLVAFFTMMWDGIKNIFTTVWTAIVEFLTPIWDSIRDTAMAVFNSIKDFFVTIWDAISSVFNTIISAIVQFITEKFNTVKVNLIRIFNEVKETITSVWNAIKAVFMAVVSVIVTFVVERFNLLKANVIAIFNAVKAYVSSVWESIRSIIVKFANAIKDMVVSIFNSIKAFFTTVWNGIKSIITSAVNSIKSIATSVFNSLKSSITNIFNSIKSVATSVWNNIKSTISNVVNGIKSTVTSGFNSVKSTVSSVWNSIKTAISTPINAAKDAVSTAISKIKGLMNFSWSLPKLKMPHFSVSGKFSLAPPSVPKLGLSWHKDGGIMEKAMAFGMNGNDIMMGGEAGPEAILPLNRETLGGIGEGIAASMGWSNERITEKLDAIIDLLINFFTGYDPDVQVVMDTGALVGAIKAEMNRQLGNDVDLRGRGR